MRETRFVRTLAALLAPAFLGSCSYSFDVVALVRDGRLMFVPGPDRDSRNICVRGVDVQATGSVRATAEAGDRLEQVRQGVFWSESLDWSAPCSPFPLVYGRLGSRAATDSAGVSAKPLVKGVPYDVSISGDGGGHGGGCFVLHERGVANLRRCPMSADPANATG